MRLDLPRRLSSLAACLLIGASALAVVPAEVTARQPAARPRAVATAHRIATPTSVAVDVRHAPRGTTTTNGSRPGVLPQPGRIRPGRRSDRLTAARRRPNWQRRRRRRRSVGPISPVSSRAAR